MQNDLLLIIAEINILKDDVTLQLRVAGLSVSTHMLPRPCAGGLVRFGDGIVRQIFRVDQRHIALVDLRLLVQQGKDTRTACQRHDDRVQLHRNLGDRLVEALVEGQEAGQLTQCQAAADAADGQRTADHRAQHIGQVAQLAVDRHRHQRVGVCLVSAVEQLIIELVELVDGDLLMAEHLDDLLAVHHLLNVAVDLAQFLLLLEEVFAGVSGQILRGQHHNADHHQRKQAQGNAQVEHREEYADHRNDGVDKLRQALADHLA